MKRCALGILICLAGQILAEPREEVGGLASYFEKTTQEIEKASEVGSPEEDRKALASMLGLDPMPERTPLQSTVTGAIETVPGIVVEKIHFQAMPGLYVTANFYRPADLAEGKKLPAVLYVCGHSRQQGPDGISYGNKAGYQHHGIWYAKNGFVCLMIDTIQLGEFKGTHHGTYRHGRWWWHARGYTPAGVEAWNGIRSLDYLQSRPEVDGDRIGVAGRSGGGAYSWWIAALDQRVKAAVPVAGITSMRNHVVDGCIEGHCDCMFMVNSRGWDFHRVASLVAPRPLLILNTDQDTIFPVDGVGDVYQKTFRQYRALKKPGNISVRLTPGPHKDTAELQEAEYRFMLRHLRGEEPKVLTLEEKAIEPADLRVFDDLPSDEVVTTIDEHFVEKAEPEVPASATQWEGWTKDWKENLKTESLRVGYSSMYLKEPTDRVQKKGLSLYQRTLVLDGSERSVFILHRDGVSVGDADLVVLDVMDESRWKSFEASVLAPLGIASSAEPDQKEFESTRAMLASQNWCMIYLKPIGVGDEEWTSWTEKKKTHLRRRFALLGSTVDSIRVAEIKAAVQAFQIEGGILGKEPKRFWIQSSGSMAGNALYASLDLHGIERLDLHDLPVSHEKGGPIYLNVTRHLDLPQAVAMAAEKSKVILYTNDRKAWAYPMEVQKTMDWPEKQILIRKSLQP